MLSLDQRLVIIWVLFKPWNSEVILGVWSQTGYVIVKKRFYFAWSFFTKVSVFLPIPTKFWN